MSKAKRMSRRQFVASAISTAAISAAPFGRGFLASASEAGTAAPAEQSQVPLTDTPPWKDQGVINVAKSPYAKLRNVPVRAVTIEDGFWATRRDINVTKSIPSMHDLLEANGRMDNFRRLMGKSGAANRPGVLRFRHLQVDRSGGIRAAIGRPAGAARTSTQNDDRRSGGGAGAQRLLEHILRERSRCAAHDCRRRSRRGPRALLHGPLAARRHRLLPRHRRPHAARRGHPLRRQFSDCRITDPAPTEAHRFRPSGNRNGADRAVSHHGRQAPACRPGGLHLARRRARADFQPQRDDLYVLRYSIHRAHQTRGPRGARDVRVLRRHRLLPGDRRSSVSGRR